MKRKSGFKAHFIVYGIALVIVLVTGTILKLYSTDPSTGFINTGSFPYDNVLVYAYRLSLIIPIIFWFFLTILRRTRHDYPLSYRHISSGVLSMLTGVFMILYTISSAASQIIQSRQTTSTLFTTSSISIKLLVIAVVILGIVGGGSLIFAGSSKYVVAGKPGAMLGAIPALWQLILLLTRFNGFIAVTTINDILMIILFMCCASMFLIGQSRIIFGLGIRNGRTYAIPTGLSVSLVGLGLTVPSIISWLVTGRLVYVLEIGIFEFLYVFFLSLYAVVFVAGFSRSIKTV